MAGDLKNGSQCKVIAGTHKGKTGKVADMHTSKTWNITITVVQDNGVRFKTLAKNAEVSGAKSQNTSKDKKGSGITEKKSKPAEIKTRPGAESVEDFINNVAGEQKRKDCFEIMEMMKKATGEQPVLWGGSIIGFGFKRYKSPASGREVDWFIIGFSPRKANLSLYMSVGKLQQDALLEKLGKHKMGMGCLYINKLEDVDLKILKKMIDVSVKANQKL